jgi:transposase-like protein
MARRERRKFSDEYKAEVVALGGHPGRALGSSVATSISPRLPVREWVKRPDVAAGSATA